MANVRYLFDDQGGFLAGDDELASYAYPTSVYAEHAKAWPAETARNMVAMDRRGGCGELVERFADLAERNARWLARLDAEGTEVAALAAEMLASLKAEVAAQPVSRFTYG